MMAESPAESTYDSLPYPSASTLRTHPNHLATLAALHGLVAPPVTACRVLELGCGDGTNLIPMAYSLPCSTFVGIDLSAAQTAAGRALAAELGLENIALRQRNILDIDADFGIFDYIIAYGVFSWVPRPVQERMFEICARHLAPNGVAYISYNTYPGWHVRGMIRDMLLYHTRHPAGLQERATRARDLLDFLVEATPARTDRLAASDVYGLMLRSEQDVLRDRPDSYLVHELLEEVNDPVYFSEFAERAARHGLQYLAEAQFSTTWPGNFPVPAAELLGRFAADPIKQEQYKDFLHNRTFRQSLLCRVGIPLDREPRPERVMALYVAAPIEPVSSTPDLSPGVAERFRGLTKTTRMAVSSSLGKAALLHLAGIWPRAVPFGDLLAFACVLADAPASAQDIRALCDLLLRGYTVDLVDLRVHAPTIAATAGARPLASPVARLQARDSTTVTNLRHESVRIEDALAVHLLRHLDGTRDRDTLLRFLLGLAAAGILAAGPDDRPFEDVEQARAALSEALERSLDWMARSALLLESEE